MLRPEVPVMLDEAAPSHLAEIYSPRVAAAPLRWFEFCQANNRRAGFSNCPKRAKSAP